MTIFSALASSSQWTISAESTASELVPLRQKLGGRRTPAGALSGGSHLLVNVLSSSNRMPLVRHGLSTTRLDTWLHDDRVVSTHCERYACDRRSSIPQGLQREERLAGRGVWLRRGFLREFVRRTGHLAVCRDRSRRAHGDVKAMLQRFPGFDSAQGHVLPARLTRAGAIGAGR